MLKYLMYFFLYKQQTHYIMTKNYYAFEYSYGRNAFVQGAPYGDGGSLYVFSSKKDREDWIERGSDFVSEAGFRDEYLAIKVRAHIVGSFGYGSSQMTTLELVEYNIKNIGGVTDMRV